MTEYKVSPDEFLSAHKDSVVDGTVYKGFRGAPSFNKDRRTATFVMSAEVEDRDGDIIVVDGIDTANFEKNPVALIFHASRNWPIGRWSDLVKNLTGRPKRLEGLLNLLPEGVEEAADKAAAHLQFGTLAACSIGFTIPDYEQIEVRRETREDGTARIKGFLMKAIELVECSPVPVPSNPLALAKAAKEGQTLARDLIEEVLDTYAKDPKTGMLVPRAEFEAAQRAASGERTTVVMPEESKGFFERMETLFAKAFPPNTAGIEAAARQAEEAAAAEAERKEALRVRYTNIKERVAAVAAH